MTKWKMKVLFPAHTVMYVYVHIQAAGSQISCKCVTAICMSLVICFMYYSSIVSTVYTCNCHFELQRICLIYADIGLWLNINPLS
jgi:hypothetical protein